MAGGDTAREVGSAGGGLAMGGNDMVMRSMLSERRSQESAADQAGLRLLEATRQSGRGMQATFERFAEQEFWQSKDLDPFVRSHPVAADRLNQLREKVAASPYADQKDPPELQLRHDMMRAKLDGHMLPVPAGVQPLPREQQQPAGALRARDRPQLLGQLRAGAARDRRADSRQAGQPLLLGAQGRAAAQGRAVRRCDRRRCARRSSLLEQAEADATRRSPTRRPRSCWAGRWSPPTIRA